MRTRQEWMGHAQLRTTEIYADYALSSHKKEMVDRPSPPSGPVDGRQVALEGAPAGPGRHGHPWVFAAVIKSCYIS